MLAVFPLATPAADDEAPTETTGPSVSIDARQSGAVNALDVEDLFKYAPDAFVSKRFAGDDDAVVSLRGTSTTQSARTLVMVDGFVVSNYLGNGGGFAPKWKVIGPSQVQQVDILYGPYSARYGGNSMGGVVAVTTRDPEQKSGYLTLQSVAAPYEQYGVDETFTGYSLEAGGAWKLPSSPWSARLNVRHFENSGQPATFALLAPLNGPAIIPVDGAYTDPRLPAPVFGASSPVEFVDNQFDVGVGYDFKNGWKIGGLLSGRLTKQDLTGARTFLRDANGAPVYEADVGFDGAAWDAGGLTFALDRHSEYLAGIKAGGAIAGWQTSLHLSHYWIDTRDTRTANFFFTYSNDGGGDQSLEGNSGWWTFDAGVEMNFEHQRLAFGVNANRYAARQDDFETSNWRTAATPLFASAAFGATRSAGAWAEDEIRIGSRSSLTLGVRADQWGAYDGGTGRDVNGSAVFGAYPDRSETSVSPKLDFRTKLGADWELHLDLGTATRFPTIGELFQGRIDGVTRALDPDSFDPGLKPERSRDANLQLARSFGGVRITASAFYQDVDDAIYFFPGFDRFGVTTTSYKSIDEVRQTGIELALQSTDFLFDGLELNLGIARLDARTVRNPAAIATEDEKLPRIPDWRVNGQLQYRLARRFAASLGWRYGSQPASDLAGQRGDAYGFQSDYLLLDARLTWRPSDSLEASLGIDNVNDDAAFVGSPLAQRTGFAEVRLRF